MLKLRLSKNPCLYVEFLDLIWLMNVLVEKWNVRIKNMQFFNFKGPSKDAAVLNLDLAK